MKTRNEILECKEGDRFIFIQYDEDEKVKGLNFHQGLSDFEIEFLKPDKDLTLIYKTLTNQEDNEDQKLFRADITKAIEMYWSLSVEGCFKSLYEKAPPTPHTPLNEFETNKPKRIKDFIGRLDELIDEYHAELYLNDNVFEAYKSLKLHAKEEEKSDLVKQVIPQEQVKLIIRALNLLKVSIELMPKEQRDADGINYDHFDLLVLSGMLKSEVSISISREEIESFVHNHGVDFPVYN